MAQLSTEVRATSSEDYGRGGRGYLESSWHAMPDAAVRRLPEDSHAGDIQISWTIDSFEGVRVYLAVEEARTLRDRLTAVIAELDGIDNEVEDTEIVNGDGAVFEPEEFVFCDVCRGRIWQVRSTFGTWWEHADEPFFGHDAVAAEPESESGTEVA
ncbi:hypothetical protein [Nocardia sp. NPDC050406]|uniref:hypothetical protein n=1 Tax=Nocardia sp. NPDC050406 TaxID=3364318 RepID=UPI00379C2351